MPNSSAKFETQVLFFRRLSFIRSFDKCILEWKVLCWIRRLCPYITRDYPASSPELLPPPWDLSELILFVPPFRCGLIPLHSHTVFLKIPGFRRIFPSICQSRFKVCKMTILAGDPVPRTPQTRMAPVTRWILSNCFFIFMLKYVFLTSAQRSFPNF